MTLRRSGRVDGQPGESPGVARRPAAALRSLFKEMLPGGAASSFTKGNPLRGLVPERGDAQRMCLLTLAQSLGTGLFLTSAVIFFTKTVGFPARELSLALSLAGFFGFLGMVPAGRLADSRGPRIPLVWCYALLSVLFLIYAFVSTITEFVMVASAISVCEVSGNPLRGALTHVLFGGEKAAAVRAQMRSYFNLGFTGGAALAGAALAWGTRDALITVLALDSALQLSCAVIAYRMHVPQGGSRGHGAGRRSWVAIRDGKFVLASILSGILEFFQPILTVALPIWIVERTGAPRALIAALTVVNTSLVVLFQVSVSGGSRTVRGSARLLLRAGLFLAAACGLFAASSGQGAGWAAGLMTAGVALLTLGEMAQSAGGWGLSFTLPPANRMGEYQGVLALGRGLQQFAGPAVVTTLTLGLGIIGWLALGAGFLLAGFTAFRAFAHDSQSEPPTAPTPAAAP